MNSVSPILVGSGKGFTRIFLRQVSLSHLVLGVKAKANASTMKSPASLVSGVSVTIGAMGRLLPSLKMKAFTAFSLLKELLRKEESESALGGDKPFSRNKSSNRISRFVANRKRSDSVLSE